MRFLNVTSLTTKPRMTVNFHYGRISPDSSDILVFYLCCSLSFYLYIFRSTKVQLLRDMNEIYFRKYTSFNI